MVQMTKHSDEIMLLNRLVEDLQKAVRYSGHGLHVDLFGYGVTMDRLNQATEVIARLEKELNDTEEYAQSLLKIGRAAK